MEFATTTTAAEVTLDLHDDALAELESLTDAQLAMIGGGQGLFTFD